MPYFSCSKHDSILVAAPDGTLYQVDISSGKIIWSFPSGTQIYDAHQALNLEDVEHNSSRQHNKFYIDCGDDWQLYIHGINSKAEASNFFSFIFMESWILIISTFAYWPATAPTKEMFCDSPGC
ncbi:putative non-specific serine/threonine protein kinase [Helianthus annuus]|nr:putative non-specific serine/threonine protein kinase [Helianthus annuus]